VIERWGEWKGVYQTVALYEGIGSAIIPARFDTVGFLVEDPKRRTGWGATSQVALNYRGFSPGDSVTNGESRRAKWAQSCMSITAEETWVAFRVVKDRNPLKWKGKDPTWTRFSLRAWASPQIGGVGLFGAAYGGRASTQNPQCGYEP
jgi:hypothetical protein